MNGHNASQMAKFDFKLLLLWHLEEISKVSSKFIERTMGGTVSDPDKEYKRAVLTLEAFLEPYLDDEYKNDKKAIFGTEKIEGFDFIVWAKILGSLMKLLDRKQWLIVEDKTAEDTDEEQEDADYSDVQ